MKVLFVRPKPEKETIGLQHVMIVEPLELEVLATLIKKQHSCTIVDLIVEKKTLLYFVKNIKPDLVCITGYITNVNTIKRYCREIKAYKPAIRTLVGGVHCEVCPDDFIDECIDYRIVRNATTAFPAFIRYLSGQERLPPSVWTIKDSASNKTMEPFNFFYPLPDRSFTRHSRHKYFYIFHEKVALIKTAFGCPYRCAFCFCRKITEDRYVKRPLDEIITELQQIQENDVYIVDDDFLSSRDRVRRFINLCQAKGVRKKYLIYGRADFICANEDLIRNLADIGLKTVIIGMESFFDDELKRYNKKSTSNFNEEVMDILRCYNIDCYVTLIVSPTWGKEEFAYVAKKLLSIGVQYVNLQPLMPLPGTDLRVPPETILLKREEYEKWDLAHVALQPEKLSIPEFYREIIKLYQKILFQPAVMRRYLKQYSLHQLYKMLRGAYLVRKQYLEKIKAATINA